MSESHYFAHALANDARLWSLTEDALVSIAALGAYVSGSSVRTAWYRRAAWQGYARALQLDGGEIDEIDVFSWGCALPLPDRPRRITVVDDFQPFDHWWKELAQRDRAGWRDRLPFTQQPPPELPRLFQAIFMLREYARRVGTVESWLCVPSLLYNLGLSDVPLPCLVAGSKAFRITAAVPTETLRGVVRSLATAAQRGIEMLRGLETVYRDSVSAIRAEYRPGKLPDLLALMMTTPLLSPSRVSSELSLSLAGAGKLLDRAASLRLVAEVSGRHSWKIYLAPDLAIAFGFRPAPVGRPKIRHRPALTGTSLDDIFDEFDRQMVTFDARLSTVSLRGHSLGSGASAEGNDP